MSLVADTGGLYALYGADDANHKAVRDVVQNEQGPIIVPSAVLGELGCLTSRVPGNRRGARLPGWFELRGAHS